MWLLSSISDAIANDFLSRFLWALDVCFFLLVAELSLFFTLTTTLVFTAAACGRFCRHRLQRLHSHHLHTCSSLSSVLSSCCGARDCRFRGWDPQNFFGIGRL